MATQLRLVEAPPARRSRRAAAPRPARGRVVGTPRRTGRRGATWGDWALDARTRRIGRAGVAAARAALERAPADPLPRAS